MLCMGMILNEVPSAVQWVFKEVSNCNSFLEKVFKRRLAIFSVATVAFSFSDYLLLPIHFGLVDRFFFCVCMNEQSFPI